MGTIEEMQAAVQLIPGHKELLTEGAGHELVSACTVADVTKTVVEAFWKFNAI